ncbi:hypothetical protein R1T08_15055 [Streptomyces sp. SBC-4]|nr:hypothetical protein [Streptomyces sp. SBC-4]MDV5145496.1 hypothetical protein [Streptomyces sp. SBC-4]
MTPEQLTAVTGLVGVGIGAGGALLGSRMQSRAADRAAKVAARATLEGVHAQVDTTKQLGVRTARRAAYGAFLKEANELHHQLDAGALDSEATAQAIRRVETALAFVALEGPEEVSDSAWNVLSAGSGALGVHEHSVAVAATWGRLGAYQELVRVELGRLRYDLSEQVSELWRPTAEWWAFSCAMHPNEDVEFPDVPEYREWNRIRVVRWADQEREDMRATNQIVAGPMSVRGDSSTPTHLGILMVREQRPDPVALDQIRTSARNVHTLLESARRDNEQRQNGMELLDSEVSALILFALQERGVTPRMAVDDASTELHEEIRTFTTLAREALYSGLPGQ